VLVCRFHPKVAAIGILVFEFEMPLCEGRSDGPGHHVPCPVQRRDSTVCRRQGDLMLCSDCNNYRFPECSVPVKQQRNKKLISSGKHEYNTRNGKQCDVPEPTHFSSAGLTAEYCPICNEPATEQSIRCHICNCLIHHVCSGIPADVMGVFLDIVDNTGWVCLNCRTDHRQKIESLQTALAHVTEKLTDVLMKINAQDANIKSLQRKFESESGQTTLKSPTTPAATAGGKNDVNSSSVAVEVHRTLADLSKRRRNVVVSGLPETCQTDSHTDEQAFLKLCEENFSQKPVLSYLGCRRLGKYIGGPKPRKLLVHLTSENIATDLLAEAKKLRYSDDPILASTVYLNPDMSPAEAKIAYERRQQRRARGRQQPERNEGQSEDDNSNNLTAQCNTNSNSEPAVDNETSAAASVSSEVMTASYTSGSGKGPSDERKKYTVVNSSFRAK